MGRELLLLCKAFLYWVKPASIFINAKKGTGRFKSSMQRLCWLNALLPKASSESCLLWKGTLDHSQASLLHWVSICWIQEQNLKSCYSFHLSYKPLEAGFSVTEELEWPNLQDHPWDSVGTSITACEGCWECTNPCLPAPGENTDSVMLFLMCYVHTDRQ